jgi:hypothetical protein
MNELTLYSYDAAPMASSESPAPGIIPSPSLAAPRPHSAEAWILA